MFRLFIFFAAIVLMAGCYPQPKVKPNVVSPERMEYLNSVEIVGDDKEVLK